MIDKLEDRLINYSCLVLQITDLIKTSETGKHMKSQLIRSGTSAALNFGEARSSESPRDMHHKFSIILKELRESIINLKIIRRMDLCRNNALLDRAINENNQLIAIFIKSIQTVRKKIHK